MDRSLSQIPQNQASLSDQVIHSGSQPRTNEAVLKAPTRQQVDKV